jgi:hypothetical protein
MSPSVAARRSQTNRWGSMLASIKRKHSSIVAPVDQDLLNLEATQPRARIIHI